MRANFVATIHMNELLSSLQRGRTGACNFFLTYRVYAKLSMVLSNHDPHPQEPKLPRNQALVRRNTVGNEVARLLIVVKDRLDVLVLMNIHGSIIHYGPRFQEKLMNAPISWRTNPLLLPEHNNLHHSTIALRV